MATIKTKQSKLKGMTILKIKQKGCHHTPLKLHTSVTPFIKVKFMIGLGI